MELKKWGDYNTPSKRSWRSGDTSIPQVDGVEEVGTLVYPKSAVWLVDITDKLLPSPTTLLYIAVKNWEIRAHLGELIFTCIWISSASVIVFNPFDIVRSDSFVQFSQKILVYWCFLFRYTTKMNKQKQRKNNNETHGKLCFIPLKMNINKHGYMECLKH